MATGAPLFHPGDRVVIVEDMRSVSEEMQRAGYGHAGIVPEMRRCQGLETTITKVFPSVGSLNTANRYMLSEPSDFFFDEFWLLPIEEASPVTEVSLEEFMEVFA